jgi:antitoxin CptB
MNISTDTLELRRKRLLWRACHRGIKEMDLLMGGFARSRLAGLSGPQLDEFEAMIDLPDQELLSWIKGELPVPANFDSALLRELLQFRP